jgi:hypothetical protein
VVLLQRTRSNEEGDGNPQRPRPTSHKGKRERNCAGDLGMTPGHSCTRTPALSAVPGQREIKATHVRPWRQPKFGLARWVPDTAERANHAVCRPQINAWQPMIGRRTRASTHKFQGHCRSLDEFKSRDRSLLVIIDSYLLGVPQILAGLDIACYQLPSGRLYEYSLSFLKHKTPFCARHLFILQCCILSDKTFKFGSRQRIITASHPVSC